MRRSLPALLMILALPGLVPAVAQDVTETVRKDLWCGLALSLAVRDVPEDASPEIVAEIAPYRAGAQALLDRTKSDHLEAGYTEEAFTAHSEAEEAEVSRQLASTDPALAPPYTFEDCAELIGL